MVREIFGDYGVIYWGDETGIQNGANIEKGYAPKGNTPIIRIAEKKEKISMVSIISNQPLFIIVARK